MFPMVPPATRTGPLPVTIYHYLKEAGGWVSLGFVLVQATVAECHSLSGSDLRHLPLTVLEAEQSKMKPPADAVSSEGLDTRFRDSCLLTVSSPSGRAGGLPS